MRSGEPTLLADILAGHDARYAASTAPRATRAADRIGVRRDPLPSWLRTAVLIRDRYTCAWCTSPPRDRGLLEVDHLVPWSAGGADHPVNLRTLCQPCNQERSNRVSGLDRRALPIARRCRGCDGGSYELIQTVPAFCLSCRRTGFAPYLIDVLVGGAVPTDGVPALGRGGPGDFDYVALGPALRPGTVLLLKQLRQRNTAQTVDCPWCGAVAGSPCLSGGVPMARSAAHPARQDLAQAEVATS